jgi:hypothetical protein
MRMPVSLDSSWTGRLSSKNVRMANFSLVFVDLHCTARKFNESPISPRKCRQLLTKISVLLFTGEKFPTTEATTLFFGISKLFQNKDPSLRQMVYLILKELAHTAEDVIMSTSIIMKDGNAGSENVYRANAIRALCRIIDVRASIAKRIATNFAGHHRTRH